MAISTNTKIAVNANFSRFRHVQEGDILLSPQGKKRTVKRKVTYNSKDNFVISFLDGSRLYCDNDTLFKLTGKWDRMEERENSEIFTPEQLLNEEPGFWGYKMDTIYKGAPNPHKEKIHPYLMGLWASGTIKETDLIVSLSEECIVDLRERGIPVLPMLEGVDVSSYMLSRHIEDIGIKTHSIPHEYLFSPAEERLELLRGITVMSGKRHMGRYSLTTANITLLSNIRTLLASLGVRTSMKRSVYNAESHYYTLTFEMDLALKNWNPSLNIESDWNLITSVQRFQQEIELSDVIMGNQHGDYAVGDTFIPLHR